MHNPPDYEGLEQIAWRENAENVGVRLSSKDRYILKKIKTYMWRFGYSEEAIKGRIQSDIMFAAWFAKEPRRTKIHERIAAAWLEEIELISDFDDLPASGPDAWYIATDGELRQGKKPATVKSLDFRWQTGQYTVFASHKYTRESGGNQDSQFQEVQAMLKHFQQCGNNTGIVLLAIVDGPYYTETKMQQLRRFERTTAPISKALPIQDVPPFLEGLQ